MCGPHSITLLAAIEVPVIVCPSYLSTMQSFVQQILTVLCAPGPAGPGDALVSKAGQQERLLSEVTTHTPRAL